MCFYPHFQHCCICMVSMLRYLLIKEVLLSFRTLARGCCRSDRIWQDLHHGLRVHAGWQMRGSDTQRHADPVPDGCRADCHALHCASRLCGNSSGAQDAPNISSITIISSRSRSSSSSSNESKFGFQYCTDSSFCGRVHL